MTQCDSDLHSSGRLYGTFAFASIVLTCFGGYFYTGEFYHAATMVPVTFALGAFYVAFGIVSFDQVRNGERRTFTVVYYLIQCGVLTALVFLSPIRGFFGMIVLPVASQSILDLRPRYSILITGYLLAVCVAVWGVDYGWGAASRSLFNYAAAFAFTIAFTLVTKQALRAREQSDLLRSELEVANQHLRDYAARADDLATTRERNRLAREIHDGLGHYLTVVKTQLDAAAALLPAQPDKARESVTKAAHLTGEALDDVRRSVGALRADAARPPLPEALRLLTQEAGLPVTTHVAGTMRPLPPAIEHALFRSAQEGLTNIRKHASASSAEVALDFRSAGRVTLSVTDNGRGTNNSSPANAGFGLLGIRERIEVLGGRVITGNRPAGGFALTIEVPA